ncbi:hypothetical protein [Tenacibaculum agarivorans]|uniref:hypothetical protein n=1 Tax=Tenacibaculum agarivorans TaxID=1908389 RepID=UPI000A571258|nr:hypothetical protein [Tenacibaculum agarivorans]
MSHIFYGTIVSKISGHFFENPDHIAMITNNMDGDSHAIWTTCTEASKVFHDLIGIIDDIEIDWELAVEAYSEAILNQLIIGDRPNNLNFIAIASTVFQDCQ